MADLHGKYRRNTERLASWDYSAPGGYFITICVKNKMSMFGEIKDNRMVCNDLGRAAEDCLKEIPRHFPFAKVDSFVVMPNHVHAIIMIHRRVNADVSMNRFGPQSLNLASIIRGFKVGVTKYAKSHNISFAWQPKYYDHVIRDEVDKLRIQEYMINNPLQWALDEENQARNK